MIVIGIPKDGMSTGFLIAGVANKDAAVNAIAKQIGNRHDYQYVTPKAWLELDYEFFELPGGLEVIQ